MGIRIGIRRRHKRGRQEGELVAGTVCLLRHVYTARRRKATGGLPNRDTK